MFRHSKANQFHARVHRAVQILATFWIPCSP
jgi:hypothetical protein